MSSDDYIMMRRHPQGGFSLVRGFASIDDLRCPDDIDLVWMTVEETLKAYVTFEMESEYGLRIHSEVFEEQVLEQKFAIEIRDYRVLLNGECDITKITVTGDSQHGYSVRNFVAEDCLVPVQVSLRWKKERNSDAGW